jgi:GT2 family glycosyltransferase
VNFSVIIPSKNPVNLLACVTALMDREPSLPPERIIVVDDGAKAAGTDHLPVTWVTGIEPFVFARNINLGIRHALDIQESDAVVLLNDDAMLRTPGGFAALVSECLAHSEYGVISATTNVVGNPQQQPRGVGLRDATRVVAFVCVGITRTVISRIGLLDERFGGVDENGQVIYGFDDNDYCRRLTNEGLKLGVYDGCYVDHGSLTSTFRGDARKSLSIEPARKVYEAKWGDRR